MKALSERGRLRAGAGSSAGAEGEEGDFGGASEAEWEAASEAVGDEEVGGAALVVSLGVSEVEVAQAE